MTSGSLTASAPLSPETKSRPSEIKNDAAIAMPPVRGVGAE